MEVSDDAYRKLAVPPDAPDPFYLARASACAVKSTVVSAVATEVSDDAYRKLAVPPDAPDPFYLARASACAVKSTVVSAVATATEP